MYEYEYIQVFSSSVGWLVGMRRSILMLGSYPCSFSLIMPNGLRAILAQDLPPCCSNPRGRHSGLGTWLNGVKEVNKAIAVDGAAEIVEIAINGLVGDLVVEEEGMELTTHMRSSSQSSSPRSSLLMTRIGHPS